MKKTKEFDNILEECLERLLAKGETLEQCLAHYPAQAAALRPLLETAMMTRQASVIYPRSEFRAEARQQFHAALQRVPVKRGLFPLAWPRWATVAAVVLVLLLAGGGTVAAASSSMPDETLYPVKLATERVWLTLTPSGIGKAEVHASLAERRVSEIVGLVNKGKPEELERVTQRLDNDLEMIAVLARARAGEGRVAPALAPAPSPPAEKGVENGGGPGNPRLARLRMTLMRYAINHPEVLRARLRTAPESAKPALRRAIAIAEARYQQALEAVEEADTDR